MSAVNSSLPSFFMAGINYKKNDATRRGRFAVTTDQYAHILTAAPAYGVPALFILSTCNRTEIYGFAAQAEQLVRLLCSQTQGTAAEFLRSADIRNGTAAATHLFKVASGLDSQLLGDYEIVGQLKQAFKFARERNAVNNFLERLFNDVLRSSKAVKNQTSLSDGTISVSFAAVQFIKAQISNCHNQPILVIGTGKIGLNTCKNLVDYLGTRNITVVNRTTEKAAALAAELGIKFASSSQMADLIASSRIIITATNAPKPIITQARLQGQQEKLVLDLSVPHNVETCAGDLPHIQLVNVDRLSQINDHSLEQRKMEAPKAELIINGYISEFLDWVQMRKNAPVLRAIKSKLHELVALNNIGHGQACSIHPSAEQLIQKVLNNVAGKMRNDRPGSCYYMQAISEFIQAAHN